MISIYKVVSVMIKYHCLMLRLLVKASNAYDVAMSGFLGRKDTHRSYVLNVGLLIGIK